MRFHPRYRKPLALLLPVVDRLHHYADTLTPTIFFFSWVSVRLDPKPLWLDSCIRNGGHPSEIIREENSEGVIQVRQSGGRNFLPFLARSPGGHIPLHPNSPLKAWSDEQRMAPLPAAPTLPPPSALVVVCVLCFECRVCSGDRGEPINQFNPPTTACSNGSYGSYFNIQRLSVGQW